MLTSFHSHGGGKRKHTIAFSRDATHSVPGADGDYANAGKRARGVGMTHHGSSIIAQTRNPVTTPQCLVNVTSLVRKDEKQVRALAAKGDKSDLLGAPTSNEHCFDVRKGMIVLHRRKNGGSFKTNLAADSNMECIGSLNGMSASSDLFMCGVAQVDSMASDKYSNNQTAVTLHGMQTVCNMSTQRWVTGDFLVADTFVPMVNAQNGTSLPAVIGPNGVPEEQLCIPLIPMGGMHLSHFITGVMDAVRLQFGLEPNREALVKAQGSPDALLKQIHSMCDKVFSQVIVVSPWNPIRGYAVLWAANRFYNMLKIDRASILTKKGTPLTMLQFGNLLRVAMKVKLMACIEVEDKFAGIANGYAAALPHGGDHEDALPANERARSTLHSRHLDNLLNPATGKTAEERCFNLNNADARIDMHIEDMLDQYHHRIRAYIAQFAAGVAMSSADKGKAADVFFGKAG